MNFHTCLSSRTASCGAQPYKSWAIFTPPKHTVKMDGHELSEVQYRIGLNVIKGPLVGVPEVKAHLTLLRAWENLKTQVHRLRLGQLFQWCVVRTKEDDLRWEWMIGLAVERYGLPHDFQGTSVSQVQPCPD
ncbi:MAG TPA: hypothetical protein VGO47_00710 [Chlamydiales bacterium]|nr:hypothetical protein [Chlamydiales bacterium]